MENNSICNNPMNHEYTDCSIDDEMINPLIIKKNNNSSKKLGGNLGVYDLIFCYLIYPKKFKNPDQKCLKIFSPPFLSL